MPLHYVSGLVLDYRALDEANILARDFPAPGWRSRSIIYEENSPRRPSPATAKDTSGRGAGAPLMSPTGKIPLLSAARWGLDRISLPVLALSAGTRRRPVITFAGRRLCNEGSISECSNTPVTRFMRGFQPFPLEANRARSKCISLSECLGRFRGRNTSRGGEAPRPRISCFGEEFAEHEAANSIFAGSRTCHQA